MNEEFASETNSYAQICEKCSILSYDDYTKTDYIPSDTDTDDYNNINGKVIVVDTTNKDFKLSNINIDLKKNGFPIANNVSEVSTLIALYYYSEIAVTYNDGSGGHQHFCIVTAIDKNTQSIIWQKIFSGSEPASVKVRGAIDFQGMYDDISDDSSRPDREANKNIIKYLEKHCIPSLQAAPSIAEATKIPNINYTDKNITDAEKETKYDDYLPHYNEAVLHINNNVGSDIIVGWTKANTSEVIFYVNIAALENRTIYAPTGYFDEYVRVNGIWCPVNNNYPDTTIHTRLRTGEEYVVEYSCGNFANSKDSNLRILKYFKRIATRLHS